MFFRNKLKKRDRIRCLYNIEAHNGYEFDTINKLGTVIYKEDGEYGIKFDEDVKGNALIDKKGRSHCKNGYGLWLKEYYFTKISEDEDIENKKEIKGEDVKMNNKLTRKMELMVEMMGGLMNDIQNNEQQEETTVYFAKLHTDVKIPSKEDENAGYDVYAHFDEKEFNFKPHETKLVPTGLLSSCSQEYVLIGKERGSTGSIGMKCGAGIIDSGYRNEIFIAITNENNVPLTISKRVNETIKNDAFIVYPYSKAVAQLLLVPVPKTIVKELSVNELKSIPSKRGGGCLGSSGK